MPDRKREAWIYYILELSVVIEHLYVAAFLLEEE